MSVTILNGRKLNRPATFEESAEALRQKVGERKVKELTPAEYEALKRKANERLWKKEAQQARNLRLASLPKIGLHENDLDLTWSAVKPGISDGMKAVEAVRPAYELGHGVVFLWGAYGQAKTLVGKIMTATAFREGKTCAYANMTQVLDDIRIAYDDKEHKNTELVRRISWWNDRQILFIDELDKASKTEWAEDRIFQLLDHRYMRAVREEALTVIASNTSDDQLDGYLRSRIRDNRIGTVVHLDGPDGREVMQPGWLF